MRKALLIIMLASACAAQATVRYVPDDFPDLQAALDAASSGDTVICRPGTYNGSFVIPPIHITLGSEYVFTADTALISTTVIQPGAEDPERRCLTADSAASRDTSLTIVGLTVTLGRATEDNVTERGGGLFVQRRNVELRDCIFSTNRGFYGGAIYAENCSLKVDRCEFLDNDSPDNGRNLCSIRSDVVFDSCDFGFHGGEFSGWGSRSSIGASSGELELRDCRIHDVGHGGQACAFIDHALGGSGPWEIRIFGCAFTNNRLIQLYSSTGSAANTFVLDSCVFADNEIGFGVFRGWEHSGMARATLTRNWFENNVPIPNYGMQGLIVLDLIPSRCVVEENYFDSNQGYDFACVGISNAGHPQYRRVWRNYFVNNSSTPEVDGGSKTVALSQVFPGVIEYNAFIGNQGVAVYTSPWSDSTGYALNNYWGSTSGPFEALRNPQGQGDTADSRTRFDPWLESEEDIPDTTILPNAADDWHWPVPSTWYIANVYPNPFNSQFHVELQGMAGAGFEIRLFDLLGREVALLHAGRTLPGNLSFNAPAGLGAGVYFLRAQDRYYGETKKVLYLK